MSDSARIYWLHTLTPLHVGSGQGVGFVDLPIVREAVTGWPYVPGTAFKGVFADAHDAAPDARKSDKRKAAAFGTADDETSATGQRQDNAGSLVFTDARLVCLPVRSIYGTFAWCTSAFALRRLHRDLEHAGIKGLPGAPDDLHAADNGTYRVRLTSQSLLWDSEEKKNVFLEDLDFKGSAEQNADQWALHLADAAFHGKWQELFQQRFAIVPNEIFDFLTETATEVQAHIRIEDATKTVAQGALWYEESLPAETLLAGLVACDRVFGNSGLTAKALLDHYCPLGEKRVGQNEMITDLQLGGKASVGKGRVRCVFQ